MRTPIVSLRSILAVSLTSLILAPPAMASETYIVTASAARLRSDISLSVDSTIEAVVYRDTKVEVLDSKPTKKGALGSWLHVRVNGKTGWINSHLLKVASNEEARAVKAPKSSKTPQAKPDVPKKAADATPLPKKNALKTKAKPDVKDVVAKGEKPKSAPVKAPDHPCFKSNHDPSMTEADKAVLKPLYKNGRFQEDWTSRGGVAFTIDSRGDFKASLRAAPKAQVDKMAAGSQGMASSEDIVNYMKNGQIAFDVVVCLEHGEYSMKLVGTDLTQGKTGHLTLIPNTHGFTAQGDIDGSPVNQNFHPGTAPAVAQ